VADGTTTLDNQEEDGNNDRPQDRDLRLARTSTASAEWRWRSWLKRKTQLSRTALSVVHFAPWLKLIFRRRRAPTSLDP
jgi:hypothetical protein